ncbi:MAG: pyridoxamine 5'-phosphate oxidase family protein [Planctomycetaceae bacterium]
MTENWFSSTNSLTQIETDCWNLLQHAVDDRNCGWRLPVLATCSEGTLRQRTLVLRQVHPEQRQILVHTDVRSGKVRAIRQSPQVTWLFYDTQHQVQLHLTGTATIHTDDAIADQLWNTQPQSSLRGYLGSLLPGRICDQPENNIPANLRGKIPTREELSSGRVNFAVICCLIDSAECLLLSPEGNRRAVFRYSSGQTASADWVVP